MIVESYEDVIRLSGPLRSNFWETIHTAISLTLKRHPTGVIIDCSDITEVTQEGAETFIDAIEFVNKFEDARIIVAAVPEHVMEVLRQVPNVRSQLPVVKTVDDARRSLDLLVEDEEHGPRRKKESLKAFDRHIVACLSVTRDDAHLLDVLEELVESMPAKAVVVAPIIVPREKPVTAPMPEKEEAAAIGLETARKRLHDRGTPTVLRIERGRDLSAILNEVADEFEAAHVVLALPEFREGDETCLKTLAAVVERVRRPLVIVRGPVSGGKP
ncbi:MAG: hypothetical protein KIT11_06600 [Fimbriimonadaceae bacterium]|nr:hypothetical protein [Fimbriimonadaceae bacterium]QYK56024.1 MAG: hypothetical protein KF733_00790 [Fimbriimonadaceae bacterium]